MAVATLAIQQFTGAGPTKTTVTTPRLSTSDSNNPGLSNPIKVPSSGLNYSFWMTLHLVITAFNDATLLNNHKFYSDGTIGWACGTNGGLFIGLKSTGDNGVPVASYVQATGIAGTTGNDMNDGTDGHTYYKTGSSNHASPVKVDTLTAGSSFTVDTGDHTEAEEFKGIVLQARVDGDATRGAQAAETLTFVYDEI